MKQNYQNEEVSDKVFYLIGSIVLTAISIAVIPTIVHKGSSIIYRFLYQNEK